MYKREGSDMCNVLGGTVVMDREVRVGASRQGGTR